MSPFRAGMIALIVVLVGTYFGFTKSVPFRHHYQVRAVFKSTNNLRLDSPVRIAGVNVGKVTKVQRIHKGQDTAVVTMRIDKKGLPLHQDASFWIRPRIFLEGNFFVDVQPGSPSAKPVGDGHTFPVQQTKTPVQLDQILTALQYDTREDLKKLLYEYSRALSGNNSRGGLGFNRSIRYWKPAYKNSAIVSDATLGKRPHDLSGYIKGAGKVAEALDRNPEQLKSLITDFNTTAAALAREQDNLEQTIAELPRTLRAGQPALAALNRSFPPLRRLVADFRPAVRSSGPAIDASLPFVRQARRLVSRNELRGLAGDLRAMTPALAQLNVRSVPLQEQVRLASSCQNEVTIPWSRDKIQDPNFPAKGKVYQEAPKPLPGLAGESRSGDANGQWFRVLVAGGNYTVLYGNGVMAQVQQPIQGTNPPRPSPDLPNAGRPPLRPDVPCETQEPPDLRTDVGPAPPQMYNPVNTPLEKARYAKARTAALRWARRSIKLQGLSKELRVASHDITKAQLQRILASKKKRSAR